TQVDFSGAPAGFVFPASFTVVSDTTVTAVVPGLATTGPIQVITNGGIVGLAASVFSAAAFTNTGPPPPPPDALTITAISPSSGPAGTVVTITGTNFTGVTKVTLSCNFPDFPAHFTVVSATTIAATVPSGSL